MQSDCNIPKKTNYGTLPKPKPPAPRDIKMLTNINNFEPKSVHKVYITHIENPEKFYVRLAEHQKMYEDLSKSLKEQYGSHFHSANVHRTVLGMSCVAYVAEFRPKNDPHVWARVRVLELVGITDVWAFLIDTGEYIKLHYSKLRHIYRDFTDINAMATRCHLSDASPRRSQWSDASIAYFKRFKGPILELYVDALVAFKNQHHSSVKVKLYDISNPTNKFYINEQIIRRYGYVPSDGEYQNLDFNTDDIKELANIRDDDFKPRDVGFARLEVKVCNCVSPSLIYLSLSQEAKTFNEFLYYIDLYYKQTETDARDDWKVDDRCCTLNKKTEMWRRAKILDLDKDQAKILYTDLGQYDTVEVSSLRLLLPEFASVRDAIVKCHLSGLMPTTGEDWPSLTTDYLNEFIRAYKQIFITKTDDFSENSLPVEIWVYDTMYGGAMEPDMYEWHCLNNKVIDLGLALPDKPEEKTDDGEASCAGGNQTDPVFIKSIHNWLQLGPMPMKPVKAKQTLDYAGSLLFLEDNCEASPANDEKPTTSKAMQANDWLPPNPFPKEEFIGMPTHITYEGIMYLQNIKDKKNLEIVGGILTDSFKHPDPWAKHYDWSVGEPCIALYSEDKQFYRAKVLEVNKQALKCFVHYIDYGNQEYRSFSEMRKSNTLYHIPTLATKCMLNRIEPADKRWESHIVDSIYKLIVDEKFHVRVRGIQRGDCVPVELKYEQNCVNDDLVKLKLAVYTEDNDLPIKVELNYPKHDKEEYKCDLKLVTDRDIIQLHVIDRDTEVKYAKLLDEMQNKYKDMQPLQSFDENQPCIALYPDSTIWYRAVILEHNEPTGQVKVKFVDYGNDKVINVSNVRDITEEWVLLPPLTISAKLYGVNAIPSIDDSTLLHAYEEVLYNRGPFYVRILKYETEMPFVELRNENYESVNEILINQSAVFSPDIAPD